MKEPDSDCIICHGSGAMDSGGVTPWGAGIDVACECTYEPPIRGAQCSNCGAFYSSEWAGTTCSACDGDIVRAASLDKEGEE
jgi:hypothetical protein